MNNRTSRRRWLATTFAAVTAWIGKAFGWTPGATGSNESLANRDWLVRTRYDHSTGAYHSTHTRLEGKVVIEPGPGHGEFLVTVFDRQQNVIEETRETLHNLFVYSEACPMKLKSQVYDARGTTDSVCRVTTYVYDSVGTQRFGPSGPLGTA